MDNPVAESFQARYCPWWFRLPDRFAAKEHNAGGEMAQRVSLVSRSAGSS